MQSFIDSADIVNNGPELQKRMDRDGYLFISELLPAEPLEDVRIKLLKIMRDEGWIKADVPLEDGVADLNGFCVFPEEEYMVVNRRLNMLQEFHALPHHPNIMRLLERMMGEPVMPHAKTHSRFIFPQREEFTTPAHQDFILIQGNVDTYTAWFPIGDVSEKMGGLQISAGSHLSGIYEHKVAMGAGALGVDDPADGTWVGGPFKQGDVLFFHSMALHRGAPCRGQQLRMSVDVRYQKISDPIALGSLTPFGEPLDWEEIYTDWSNDDLKYYWKKWDMEVAEYDQQYNQKRNREAFEMGEKGDKRVISALQRIKAFDGDTARREKAENLLATLQASPDAS